MNQLPKFIPNLPKPLEGYGLPKSKKSLLTWEFVSKRMKDAPNYWVCTVGENGLPHVRPVWGVWVNETLFFGGSPDTRWFRNLQANPQITVHLESGSEAIIFEGQVTLFEDGEMMKQIDDAYEAKYNLRHGPPIWQLRPDRIFAWSSMQTMTKFTIGLATK